jgi:Protein of unknown function (DUF3313)
MTFQCVTTRLQASVAAITLAVSLFALSDAAEARKALPETTPEGLKLVPKTKVSAVYLREGVTFGGYTKVAILDCYVAFKKNWQRDQNTDSGQPFKVSDSDVTRIKTELADEFKKVFSKELTAKGQTVVTTAGPDVLILRPAIINLDVAAPDTMQPGITHSFSASAGQATLFLELYDSVTSELLARVYDAEEVDGMGFISVRNSVTNRSDATRMLKKWADLLGTHLANARAGASTPANQ